MPRTYKPSQNKNYKKYDQSLIQLALQEYNSTTKSLSKVSEQYKIPKSVLHRHNRFIMKKQGGQTALSIEEEEYLIEYINLCSEWGYPLETFDLRIIIKSYLDRLGTNVKKFKNNMPGPDYVKSFIKRHCDKITSRLCQNIKRSRAAVSPEIIEQYFNELEKSLQDIPLSNIINYDETNLTDDPGRKKVLVRRSTKYPERVMNHTKGSTSLMMAAAADGTILAPYVVYKSQHVYDTWRQNGPVGCRYNCTTSGWFDTVTFDDWVRTIMFPYFKDKNGAKILIGDNLSSHLSIDLIRECKKHDIRFIFLPANSTHLTQPLDVAVFRPLKCAWRNILHNWKKTDGRTQASIPKSIFPSLLKKLMNRIECNISDNILAGFQKCGISPIDRNKVLGRLPTHGKEIATENNFRNAIDVTVLSMLKEMRYGSGSTRQSNKKKKIEVVPGRSVENKIEDTTEHEFDTEEASANESNTEQIPTISTSKVAKQKRGKETNNISLIKKTKYTKKSDSREISNSLTTIRQSNQKNQDEIIPGKSIENMVEFDEHEYSTEEVSENESNSEEIQNSDSGASTSQSSDIVGQKRGKKTNDVTLIKKTKYDMKCDSKESKENVRDNVVFKKPFPKIQSPLNLRC